MTSNAESIHVGEPALPRRRNRPCDSVVDCAKETSRKQRRTSIVRNTSKPIIPSSTATRTSSTNMDLIHHSSYSRIAANEGMEEEVS